MKMTWTECPSRIHLPTVSVLSAVAQITQVLESLLLLLSIIRGVLGISSSSSFVVMRSMFPFVCIELLKAHSKQLQLIFSLVSSIFS